MICWRYLLKQTNHACPSTWKKPLKGLPKSQEILRRCLILLILHMVQILGNTTLKICKVNYSFIVGHLQLLSFSLMSCTHKYSILPFIWMPTFVILRLLPCFITFVAQVQALGPNGCGRCKEWYCILAKRGSKTLFDHCSSTGVCQNCQTWQFWLVLNSSGI